MLSFNFQNFPHLSTKRLTLRPVLKTDCNEIFRLRSHPEVMRYIAKKPVETMEEAVAFIERIAAIEKANECVTWAITIKGNKPTCWQHMSLEFKARTLQG
ncbi:MAG: GNAT family N-acetyltransferase [Bacteroidetes bacterium]|nr:GNAT family N-acetyltransferase [Bacteroidota bacterium]